MNRDFQRLYEALVEERIDTSQFLREVKSLGDYSDDLLEALNSQLKEGNRRNLSKLIWAVEGVPDRKFTPLLCELLDKHRYDGYMEALADMLSDIRDEKSVPCLIRALDYYVEGDGSNNFNIKLLFALDRIGTTEALDGIKLALHSPKELIRETAKEFLAKRGEA
jgi:hypothetical protein